AYVSDRSPPKREHHLVICLPDLAQADRVAAFPTLMQPLEEVPDLIAPHQFLALDELRRRLQLGIVREDRDQRLNVAAVPEIYRAAHQFDILLRNTPSPAPGRAISCVVCDDESSWPLLRQRVLSIPPGKCRGKERDRGASCDRIRPQSPAADWQPRRSVPVRGNQVAQQETDSTPRRRGATFRFSREGAATLSARNPPRATLAC